MAAKALDATTRAPARGNAPASAEAERGPVPVLSSRRRDAEQARQRATHAWDEERFEKALRRHRASAMRQVAAHNAELVKSGCVDIPRTEDLQVADVARMRLMRPPRSGRIVLRPWKTDEAVRKIAEHGYRRICALNFANRRGAGGGYLSGAIAQEEHLCRVAPALYASLAASKYPFHHYQQLKRTPNIAILRDGADGASFVLLRAPASCDVVTAAAPDLPNGEVWDDNSMHALLEAILVAGCEADAVVLGAFGNGAFRNDPNKTAALFGRALARLRHLYDLVVFAIPDPTCENYRAYARQLAPLLAD